MEDINTRYNQDIEDFFANKLEKNQIELGTPGEILSEYLNTKDEIIIRTSVLAKKKKRHNLVKTLLLNLPKLLNDPIFIFKYDDERFIINVFIEKYNHEGLLLVSLCDDGLIHNKIDVIEILTIHGNSWCQLEKKYADGKLLYINKKKFDEFFSDSGINRLKSEKFIELINDKDTTKKSDSDTVNKKNISEELGAVEVLEQNTHTDTCGLQPTYQILSSYNHLFDDAGYDFPAKKGGLEATLTTIKDIINRYNNQASRIAAHLKADTLKQSAFNIWHFCVNNIAYKLDKEGYEELRTPNRTWKDRFTGVDCDDFAIFSSCILLQMGYMPQLAVVAFNNNAQFGHIYTVLDSKIKEAPYNLGEHDGGAISGGVVIDPVLRTIFNKHPKGITKARVMNIQVLNGIQGKTIKGFGAVLPADATTQKLIEHYNKLLILKRSGQKSKNINGEMRKLLFMIKMNGTPERNLYLEIMPLVHDIDKYGQFIFISEDAAVEAVNFLDATVGKGLMNQELVYENGKAIPVLKGLGSAELGELAGIKKIFKKVKDKVKAATQKVKDTAKKVAEGVKDGVTKVKDAVVRYNPVTIASRNALLLAISVNFRNLARRMYLGLMSATEIQKAGYTPAEHARLKAAYAKNENLFVKMGGKKENLKKTIIKGKDKKPLFGSIKKKPNVGSSAKGKNNITGYKIVGLGDPVTFSAILAGLVPILAFIKNLIGSGVIFKKNEEDITHEDENIIPFDEEDAFFKNLKDGSDDLDYDDDDDDYEEDDSSGSNTLLYVGGFGLLAFLGIMAFRKNN